jgi:hypothetical protein
MVPSPKQFIHALGTGHLLEFQQQQKQDATLLTTHQPSKHKNKIAQPLGFCSSILILERFFFFLPESSIELRLNALSYEYQRFKI